MKKIITLVLSLLLVIAFTLTIGCKKPEAPAPAPEAPAPAPEAPAPAPEKPAK